MTRNGAEGGKRGGQAGPPRSLRFAQRLVPAGRRVLPLLPERLTQLVMGGVLARWPQLWGLSSSGTRTRSARRAFELALPDQGADGLISDWVAERGRGMATCLPYLSRWISGRSSRLVRPVPEFELPQGPCVVAFLHYSIDPVVQLACVAAAGEDFSFRWSTYPMQPGVEDDRELWLAGTEMPAQIEEALLPITDPSWVATALDHLRDGGTLFTAVDAPFDSNRAAANAIPVGRAQLPLNPSIELFAQIEDVRLVLAWPSPRSRTTWDLELRQAASVAELTALAGEWIESYSGFWAGWPYLVWRENASDMRENVIRIRDRRNE